MADPAPRATEGAPNAAEPRHHPAELIDELGSGGPWQSDDEFEQWMKLPADARR